MRSKRFYPKGHRLYLGLLIAALIVAACGPKATPEPTAMSEPTATPTPLPPTDTPAPTAIADADRRRSEGQSEEVPTPTLPALSVAEGSESEVPMGFTEDGAPYRGNPNAPVTLVEHSEFQ